MKLADMNDAEKQALGSLVRVMVQVDGSFSPDESEELADAADDLGAEEFWKLVERAGELDLSEKAVKAAAVGVQRREVQEAIYGVLFSVAVAGSIDARETELLDWLAETWGLEITDVADDSDFGDGDE